MTVSRDCPLAFSARRSAPRGNLIQRPAPVVPILAMLAVSFAAPALLRAEEPAVAETPAAPRAGDALSVEELTARFSKSVVVVTFQGRDGKQQGLGSGFILSPDGLIGTNLHVIGEARPISVKTLDGKEYAVTEIHANDRRFDLAVLKVDAKGLPALELGDSSKLAQGEQVATIGSPVGLKYSVVAGVMSGRREIDGMPMLQLAMPIEPGNSGGPLLDMRGRVHGIITLKSLVTRNLGFAVEINALKPLLEKPNPIPMPRWLTIGTLDPREWLPLFGSNWRQRAGRIQVDGAGNGIGRRSLAVYQDDVPKGAYEVAVSMKLSDEDGAAGLIFHSDGAEKHYGFYPSGGKLRFSRFDGADVFNWQVLKEFKSDHYRPGDWNTLKVRIDGNKYKCFVNDESVLEISDGQYITGKVGLAHFRQTKAEFKGFRIAVSIPPSRPSEESVERIAKFVADIAVKRPPKLELIEKVTAEGDVGAVVLRERARLLEQQAERLRQLARASQQQRARDQLKKLVEKKDAEFDLLHAALLIAKIDNDELDVEAYLRSVERMAAEVKKSLPADAAEEARLAALNKHLFDELGFHGSRTDYYNKSNSYLNEVIDDREGLPITLAVLYIDVARRVGANVVGVGMPGHFLTRYEPKGGEAHIVDVFERGKKLTREEAIKMVTDAGRTFDDEYLATQTGTQILIRMLRNLMGIARDAQDAESMLQYVETVLVLDPLSAEDRWFRAALRYQTGRSEESLADVEWLLDREPPGIDLSRVRQLKGILQDQ